MIVLTASCTHYISRIDPVTQSRENSSLNRIIRDISFFPVNGVRFRLSELKDIKAVVIIMRARDCPISEKYGPRIASMEDKYSKKGILFIYNYVGQLNPEKDANSDLKKFGFKGPYVIDSKQTIADTLSVQTTGDVFILTPKRRIIYNGPLDDQYHLLKSALKVKTHYVSDILDSIIAGQQVIPKALPAPGCVISRPVVKKVFYEDVIPIFQKKCVNCHNSFGSGPINFLNYQDFKAHRAMIKYVIENNLMPPWHLDPNTGPWENDLSLTPKERVTLLKWLNSDLPRKKRNTQKNIFTNSIYIKNPDYTIKLKEPIKIPATGIIPYKEFVINPKFEEDKYIKEYEFILKPKVIHHAVVRVVDNCILRKRKVRFGRCEKFFNDTFVWVGSRFAAKEDPKLKNLGNDIGIKIPKKSFIHVQLHYVTTGESYVDSETKIKLKFHKKIPKYKRVSMALLDVKNMNIPPYQINYLSEIKYKLKESMKFVSFSSHMHFRGKASAISVIGPKTNDSSTEKKLFRLDPYNYNFQRIYYLKKPETVKKGSVLVCRSWFDNSSGNPINPDPSQNVGWGKDIADEMSICSLHFIVPVSQNVSKFF